MQAILKKSDAAEPFTFAFLNGDGKSVLRSENYKAKSSATNGIESVKKHCVDDARYELKEAKNGKLFFNLKSSNGQVVATSAMFDSAADRDACIAELKSDGPGADLDDQT
ncbi:MAG: YegP family protein [Gammaproteobacteria bacterium]|nr:YegP family protein [Gammaproteobacteria bacterium]